MKIYEELGLTKILFIFNLGEETNMNEVILGDCLQYMKSLEGKVFDVAFTSPPYNRIRDDTYDKFKDINPNYCQMLCDVTKHLLRLTKGNVIINVQSNLFNKADVARWQGQFADKLKGTVIWIKNNPQPATNYRNGVYSVTNAYEYFFVFGEDSQEFTANSKIYNYVQSNVNSEHFKGHGAVMKLEIAEWFIRNFSKKGDYVFDPFFGCGTTGVACIRNSRNWGGVEIVPEYKAIAEKRIKEESLIQTFDFGGEE